MKIRSQSHWVGLLPIGCSHLFISIFKEHRPDKEGSGNPSVGDERKDKTRFLELDSPALHPANDNTWSFVRRVIEVDASCLPLPFALSFTKHCRLSISSGNFFSSVQPERVRVWRAVSLQMFPLKNLPLQTFFLLNRCYMRLDLVNLLQLQHSLL